jgi:UDP-N-acetylmuramate--alanine ligase
MLTKKSHIHFVGIGGIGMSGIATILKQNGHTISGCDPDTDQETVTQLQHLGCKVYKGNNSAECAGETIDILVYIPMYATTIPAVTAEIARAQACGIPTMARAQMLNELMRTKYSIAISGSHGKTTTTSLISHILIAADMDPTVVIGGQLKNIGSNARSGNGNVLIAEADESDRSFLQLHANIAVVTNIDVEHLETYADLDDIKHSFTQFLNGVPADGKAVICVDDENVRAILPLEHTTISYGIEHAADFFARDIVLNADYSIFDVYRAHNKSYSARLTPSSVSFDGDPNWNKMKIGDKRMRNKKNIKKKFLDIASFDTFYYVTLRKTLRTNGGNNHFFNFQISSNTFLGTIRLPIPGKHNVYNALAAIAVAQEVGIDFKTIAKNLASFAGVARRFSFHGMYQGAEIFDDYGHHPAEIENILKVARQRARNKLIVVFQPHRYTRTQKLWGQFLSTFATSTINHLIITDIYSAGEYPIMGVSSKRLSEELLQLSPPFTVNYIPFEDDFAHIKGAIALSVGHNDLLLFLGAGKVHLIANEIAK